MKVEDLKVCKSERCCNECSTHGADADVKELYLGKMVIALCHKCRQDLKKLMEKEQ